MTQPRITQPLQHRTLDPCTLGRPVHLLHHFTSLLREDLSEVFRTDLNRRYLARFHVGEISMTPMDGATQTGRWLAYDTESGQIGCTLDRNVILTVLSYRYGLHERKISPDMPPETATEERLAASLSMQFVRTLIKRIKSKRGVTGSEMPLQQEFSSISSCAQPHGTWLIKVTIQESAHNTEGALSFTLDDAGMNLLLQNIVPVRDKPNENRHYDASPLTNIPLKLVAHLVQKELLLGELLDIQVGDIVPISLNAANVLIDGSRLFTAVVAEHKGKLCLTSFENAE